MNGPPQSGIDVSALLKRLLSEGLAGDVDKSRRALAELERTYSGEHASRLRTISDSIGWPAPLLSSGGAEASPEATTRPRVQVGPLIYGVLSITAEVVSPEEATHEALHLLSKVHATDLAVSWILTFLCEILSARGMLVEADAYARYLLSWLMARPYFDLPRWEQFVRPVLPIETAIAKLDSGGADSAWADLVAVYVAQGSRGPGPHYEAALNALRALKGASLVEYLSRFEQRQRS